MRQRTITDFFWRDPALSQLSVEDKATAVYCLTSPSSNMIGVYQIVPRVCAAEMGWTAEQFCIVLERLDRLGVVRYAADTNWLWVRVWWRHNKATMALGPKLIGHTIAQIKCMPEEWRFDWLDDLATHGINIQQLIEHLEHRVSIGLPTTPDGLSTTQDRPSRNADGPSAYNVSKRISNRGSASPTAADHLKRLRELYPRVGEQKP